MVYTPRPLDENDYDKFYLNLLKQLSQIIPENISRKDFREFIEGLNLNHRVFVIEDMDRHIIIGTITIIKEPKVLHNLGCVIHVEDLVVHKDYRNTGLAKKLLDLAKSEQKKYKAYKIILDCSNELEKFYNKQGFCKKNIQMSLYS